jgi:small subunit ribosomal protein S20
VLKAEAAKGTRRIAVAAPGFSADCLETLEELAIRGRDDFLAAGGTDFATLSCLNAGTRASACLKRWCGASLRGGYKALIGIFEGRGAGNRSNLLTIARLWVCAPLSGGLARLVRASNQDFPGPSPDGPPEDRNRTDMANTPQARKRIRRNERRAEINGNRLSRIRTFVKKVRSAIAGGDKSAAAEALKAAQPELARGVARGVLHKNTVARKMSRLTKRVAAL